MFAKILCTLALGLVSLFPASARAGELKTIEPLISHSTRLMIFSPHPDDETLGAGGLIQRVLEAGGQVKVVFMTNGDGFPEGVEIEDHVSHPSARDFNRYGELRRIEALRALTTLGIKERSVIFLGFPDGGLSLLRLKSCLHRMPYRSPFTRKFRPPPFETIVPRTDYCAEDLRDEVERVIVHFKPTLVATTGPLDQHPDHSATYDFLEDALAQLTGKHPYLRPLVLTFVIHYDGWPLDQEQGPGTSLEPPNGFPGHGQQWIPFNLTPREVEIKRKAILKYHSQALIMGRFLLGFARSNELFMMAQPDTNAVRPKVSVKTKMVSYRH